MFLVLSRKCAFQKNVKNANACSFPPLFFLYNCIVLSIYSSNFHAVKRESDGTPGDLGSLENERQIYKSVLEGGDIPLQGLSGLKRPASSASTKGNGVKATGPSTLVSGCLACLYSYQGIGSSGTSTCWDKFCLIHIVSRPLSLVMFPPLVSYRPFFFLVLIVSLP